MHTREIAFAIVGATFLGSMLPLKAADDQQLGHSLLFHASFDKSANADVAQGDGNIYTADSLKREKIRIGLHGDGVEWDKSKGRIGGALHFTKKSPQLVFFKGNNNVPFANSDFEGTVSMWMRLSPSKDLPQGYVDPLQITDKQWNDASFFVDFDQAEERDFRLGVFSDYKFWNPTNRKFDDIPIKERPMVFVKKPPFERDKWTHVAFTWKQFNTDKQGKAVLYIDGKDQGTINGRQRITWNPEEVVIMLGINYVGWIDDLAIFKNALSADEVQLLRTEKRRNLLNGH